MFEYTFSFFALGKLFPQDRVATQLALERSDLFLVLRHQEHFFCSEKYALLPNESTQFSELLPRFLLGKLVELSEFISRPRVVRVRLVTTASALLVHSGPLGA